MNIPALLPQETYPSIGNELGYGAHGQVFALRESSTKVIKFTKLYDNIIQNLDEAYTHIKDVYSYLLERDYPCFVKVYDYKFVMSSKRATVNGPQDFIIFYSIMEKLQSLEEDEKKVFKTICDKYNYKTEKNTPIKKLLDELSAWLIFDKDKALIFWDALQSSPIDHNDVHRRNIMKDANNNYKLVDFDKAKLVEINNDKGT